MSTFVTPPISKLARPALLLALTASLSACGITKLGDIPEYLDSPFEQQGPREFITQADLQKVRLGMSYLEVQNRLGPPMLNDPEEKERWDYVLRKGSGADEEFISYGV
ncbi:MAG: outer membrane protein assembly factor BamE, partial [Limnobacter sp.]|nr:outer membrane protein assembly factor BamE [Limnobacter sp.]